MDRRVNFTPALIAAFLLHLAVVLGSMFAWPQKDLPLINSGVTTVTVVDAPAAELRPAVAAEETVMATTEQPDPNASLEPPAPTPAPEPPQPVPAPAPAPAPAPKAVTKPAPAPAAAAKPAPAKPAPKPSPGLDLDALTSSLAKSVKSGGARSSAPKGANRAETATVAREGKGSADAALADASAAVGARLMRMWNPNCSVEGAGAIVVRVRFNLTPDGALAGPPQVLDHGSGAVWQTAADRAVRAVAQAAPYSELPKQTYSQWKVFVARFNGEAACR